MLAVLFFILVGLGGVNGGAYDHFVFIFCCGAVLCALFEFLN
jgi:hypothetical protein